MVLEIKCKGSFELSLDKMNILQDSKDFILKDLTEKNYKKLKNSITKYGFLFPFFGWLSKEENKWYITDGTQRLKVLKKMKEDGEKLPKVFPVIEIFAKDKQEAAKAILLQSSRYGKITQDGFDGFISEFNLQDEWLDELDFPENLRWEDGTLLDDKGKVEPEEKEETFEVVISCESEQLQQSVYDALKDKYVGVNKK